MACYEETRRKKPSSIANGRWRTKAIANTISTMVIPSSRLAVRPVIGALQFAEQRHAHALRFGSSFQATPWAGTAPCSTSARKSRRVLTPREGIAGFQLTGKAGKLNRDSAAQETAW